MAAELLAKIPEADIDPNGVFKYVLIRVNSKTDDSYVDVVRGYAWAEYHGTVSMCDRLIDTCLDIRTNIV